ncbi:hypothetical protein ACROYT_G032521 [Oculina patagonica]
MNKDELVELLAKSQEAILERVDSKLQDLKRSISEDQEDCVRYVVKKVKEDHSIKWKKVGNKKHFKFNESVEAKIDSAIAAVDKKKLDKVKKELEEGKKLLSDRQKLIKLADRSECGWATVSAYVTDDLADSPDDERRISKAEKSAKKALESKREKSRAKSELSSSGEELASLVDQKVIGGTTAPISLLLQDQISQPSDAFDFEKSSEPGMFKITKLKESISHILAQRLVNAKDLASIAGQLNSVFLAIGNIVRLMSRSMYAQISVQSSWFSTFSLEHSVVEELVFWQSNLDHLNGRRIWFKSSAVRVAYSDASDTGYGGYIVELGPQVAAQGVWSADLAKESSTMREIVAVRKVLHSFAPKLAGLCVKWHTDNQNVARIIDVGSRKSSLQVEAKRIFEICVLNGISIEPEWVPRSSNEQADYLSRIVDIDDWFVSPRIFRLLDLKWGSHSIDRFADEHNHLLPRFDSRFWNPLCEAMDTFTRSWSFDNNWLCPPPHLVPRALKHMRSCCARAAPQDDDVLSSLANSLPDVALAGRAPSTSSKYSSTYLRWKSWAREHGLCAFPASPFHFALYLRHLMTEAKTASPVESAVHSIAWIHQLGGEPSPTEHPLVKSILAGLQRLLAHHTSKKEPITVSQLEQLVSCAADAMASLYNIRSVVICLLAFAAFLRFDELAKLVRSDVEIKSDMLQLFIESSKTDQFRDRAWVVVASSGKVTCPVALMRRYLDRAKLSDDSPLFCQLSKTKFSYKPRSKGLSYTRLRELVLEAFKDIVPDISAIGTHSLRSGGATAAANAGIPDRLFKRHGR